MTYEDMARRLVEDLRESTLNEAVQSVERLIQKRKEVEAPGMEALAITREIEALNDASDAIVSLSSNGPRDLGEVVHDSVQKSLGILLGEKFSPTTFVGHPMEEFVRVLTSVLRARGVR